MTVTAGEVGFNLSRFQGVVEDEEPVLARAEPLLDRSDDRGLVGLVFFRQVELAGQGGIVGSQLGGFFGSQPPDQVVFKGIAISVFQGGLGLADAAEAVQGLGEDGGAVLVQGLVKAVSRSSRPVKLGLRGWGTFQTGGCWVVFWMPIRGWPTDTGIRALGNSLSKRWLAR